MDKPTEILPRVLQDLDKQVLIEIIIRQGGELQDLWKEREEMKKKIEELERASKRPTAPFRIEDEKKRKGDNKKRAGAKKGHKGHYRTVSGKIDAHKEVPLKACPDCVVVGKCMV